MKKNLFYIIASLVLVVFMSFSSSLYGQSKLDIDNLTKDEIVNLSYETLMEMPLGDLMRLADIVGMTTDELLQLAIVSASKESESLFDAPLSASVLTGENIKKAGVTSIMEALRLAPGVIVREQTPGNYDIHIRGYDDLDPNGLISFTRNALTLVMVNNRIVYNEFQGNTYWELLQLSVDDVDRIEVVRGPVSAMYGPNAVSGVINILTKNPGEEKGMHVSTYSQAGAFNTMVGNAALSYGAENGFSVRVAGNYDYRHRHQTDYYILSGKRYVRNAQGVIIGAEEIDGGFVDELTGDELNIAGGVAVDPDANPAAATPNFRERYPYPDLATDRKSVNAHLAYAKPDYTVNVMGGYATAMVQSAFPINNFAALSTDSLNNMFGHLWGNYKDFTFSADYNVGDLKTLGSGSALQADYQILNFNAEYSYDVFEGFNLKPGLSYRNAVFNGRILGSTQLDENYNLVKRDGDQVNTLLSGYLRAEYKLNSFRFIAAVRADKFEYPDKLIVSPLLTATYKMNENVLLRASYGQATRSPFMINLFTNLDMAYPIPNPEGVPATYNTIYGAHYRGTEYQDKDYQLLNVEEVEVGTRFNVNKWLSLDLELFWSQMKNLDVFAKVARSTNIVPSSPTEGTAYISDTTSFTDIAISPQQVGGTLSVFANPMKNLDIQLYLTLQETQVKNYYDSTGYKTYYSGPTDPGFTFLGGSSAEVLDSDDPDSDKYRDFYHKATPTYFGGVNINYRPIPKLNVNVNSYFYGAQTFSIGQGNGQNVVEKVKSNILVNATIGYEVRHNVSVFINGRNLVGGNKRQFAITDKINAMVLAGINISM